MMDRIGPILIVEGPNNSKVPYSRSLYLDCSEKILIDSGADATTLLHLDHELGVNQIFNTHYHPDHTRHNYLFKKAVKLINPIEYETTRTLDDIARAYGIFQEWGQSAIEKWKSSIPQKWVESLRQISGSYEYETEYQFGKEKVIFLHTPGHTSGFSCPYFPDLGVVFTADYDMTSFGPWYNGADGDIEDFIASGQRLLSLDVKTYITGHQKGIFTNNEYHQAMKTYLSIIDRRDEIIDRYVQQGLNFNEIAEIGIFYPKKALQKNPILKTWERSGIRKHLKRLGYSIEEKANEIIKM
ncbi:MULTISPECIES: MBL fold metallo-hydrolase [Neobacillus]|jgi:hydroxyacylglutathione hydrolase|nr:MBL fold metallo-hydrolase [Neobacillus sedimentimangrovi]